MPKIDPRNLPPFALELIAQRFKALSEINRLKIVIALEQGERNVTALISETGLSQTNVSRHLQTLVDAGVLSRRKAGISVFYSIADPAIFKMCELVCGGLAKRLEAQATAFRPR